MTATRSPARRVLVRMAAGVAALHAVAIALHVALDIPGAPPPWQRAFAGGWLIVTVLVILPALRRLHRLRRGPRAEEP